MFWYPWDLPDGMGAASMTFWLNPFPRSYFIVLCERGRIKMTVLMVNEAWRWLRSEQKGSRMSFRDVFRWRDWWTNTLWQFILQLSLLLTFKYLWRQYRWQHWHLACQCKAHFRIRLPEKMMVGFGKTLKYAAKRFSLVEKVWPKKVKGWT